jgi:hypothetical protein
VPLLIGFPSVLSDASSAAGDFLVAAPVPSAVVPADADFAPSDVVPPLLLAVEDGPAPPPPPVAAGALPLESCSSMSNALAPPAADVPGAAPAAAAELPALALPMEESAKVVTA